MDEIEFILDQIIKLYNDDDSLKDQALAMYDAKCLAIKAKQIIKKQKSK